MVYYHQYICVCCCNYATVPGWYSGTAHTSRRKGHAFNPDWCHFHGFPMSISWSGVVLATQPWSSISQRKMRPFLHSPISLQWDVEGQLHVIAPPTTRMLEVVSVLKFWHWWSVIVTMIVVVTVVLVMVLVVVMLWHWNCGANIGCCLADDNYSYGNVDDDNMVVVKMMMIR